MVDICLLICYNLIVLRIMGKLMFEYVIIINVDSIWLLCSRFRLICLSYILSVMFKYSLLLQISEYSQKNVCFVMFVDEQTFKELSSEGNTPNDRGFVGLWRIVIVRNLPYEDMRKTGKVPKFLSHRLFPSSR